MFYASLIVCNLFFRCRHVFAIVQLQQTNAKIQVFHYILYVQDDMANLRIICLQNSIPINWNQSLPFARLVTLVCAHRHSFAIIIFRFYRRKKIHANDQYYYFGWPNDRLVETIEEILILITMPNWMVDTCFFYWNCVTI